MELWAGGLPDVGLRKAEKPPSCEVRFDRAVQDVMTSCAPEARPRRARCTWHLREALRVSSVGLGWSRMVSGAH